MTEQTNQPVSAAEETDLDPRSAGEAQTARETSGSELTEIEQLRADLQQAREEAADSYDKFLRTRAEMENFKKRMERTYADRAELSKKELLRKLLGVKDNIERALHYGTAADASGESLLEGVRLTQYQLDRKSTRLNS